MNEEYIAKEFQRQLDVCLEFLKDKPLKPTINKKVTTVTVKQFIEANLKTYVSRDAVLEAVKQLGIPYLQDAGWATTFHLALPKEAVTLPRVKPLTGYKYGRATLGGKSISKGDQ